MNNKNIIFAGVVAMGLYLLSQPKKTVHKTPDILPIKKMAEKMAAERMPPNASPTAEKELAEKIYADMMARRAAAAKKIPKKIPEASTPAARRKIAEKKAAAAAAAAEKAAFTPEIKLAIAILSTSEKIQALVAYRKKIAAEKKVSPQSISLTPDQRARVLLGVAIEKAAKSNIAPILIDNFKKKKKKNKTPDDIKEEFGSWDNEPEGQETSHKSTDLGYSKKKTKEEIWKLFGLRVLPTSHRPKSVIRKKQAKKKAAQKTAAQRAWIERHRKIRARKAAAQRAWIERHRKIRARKAAAQRMIPKNKNISKYSSLRKKRLLSRRKQR